MTPEEEPREIAGRVPSPELSHREKSRVEPSNAEWYPS
jgi:hypothetical protein